MERREFVFGMGAALAVAATPAAALSEAGARKLVDALVAEVNKAVASGKSESAMFRDFEKIFARYSDSSYISAYAMGVDARRASAAQKRAFSKAFQGYIARKYGRRFREFIGSKIEVQGVRKKSKWYEVSTKATLRGKSPFDITFFVSDRSGKGLFFNMYIEGINMLLTERTEVGAMLDQRGGNIDKMIADLKKAG